jgi:hypothetical protein
VSEADKVASRFTLHGTHRGRAVALQGIVISRFHDGRIIEDWAVTDTVEILRQLGPGRPPAAHRPAPSVAGLSARRRAWGGGPAGAMGRDGAEAPVSVRAGT